MTRRRLIGARRDHGAQYLLLTIASFAATVAATRWYLDLAGYPTVGGGELHIAHALWGGIALVVAAILPLLWVGHRSLVLSALLAGVGVGLFIDEVGKFLTTSTDYFFAPAAPIIYGTLLLLVLLWLFMRRSSGDALDATHAVLDALRDGVDGRLTAGERERVVELRHEKGEPIAGGIHAQLLAVLESQAIDNRLVTGGPLASGKARQWLERWLPTRLERWLVYLGLALSLLGAVVAALGLAALHWTPEGVDLATLSNERVEIPEDTLWIGLLLAVNIVVGVSAVVALGLRVRGDRRWIEATIVAVLIDLVVGELVAFYAVQFSALGAALWGVIMLGLAIDLRIRESNATLTATTAEP